jgi:hypothetical protein
MDFTSAAYILNLKDPRKLFYGDGHERKRQYINLVKYWHPDHNKSKESNEVMTKINALYSKAEGSSNPSANLISFTCLEGKTHNIRYVTAHTFELGEMYVGNTIVAFAVGVEHRDLFENAKMNIRGFKYANDKMREEFSKYLPTILDTFESGDKLVLVLRKTPDLLLLRDVLNYYSGKIDPRHVAWIQSTLHNLSCYFEFAGITHNAISADTYFISPEFHGGALLGGWWYAVPKDSKLLGVPAATYSVMPPKIKGTKVGSTATDLELIKAVGRELLGDRNGTRLNDNKEVPESLVMWLRSATSDTAVNTYVKWGKVLDASFGPRKFIPLEITADILYGG